MEATSDRKAAAAGGEEHEFVVHIKHTCDKCYEKPIIGKRYNSKNLTNFDLCSGCFDAYDGPDIGLSKALLTRDKQNKNKFVLKLKINNGEDEAHARRVNVNDIWDTSIGQLSYSKLLSIASRFAFPDEDFDSTLTNKAKCTYIDEDGDRITVSSNEELMDAFRQTLKTPPKPFRITVAFLKKGEPANNQMKVALKLPRNAYMTEEGFVVARAKNKKDSQNHVKARWVSPASLKIGKGEMQARDMCYQLGPCPVAQLPAGKNEKSSEVESKQESKPKQNQESECMAGQTFDNGFFIHARHTCDGCSKTPIIGTRYHATKIPDFDLCASCFKEYNGEDLDFKPEILERDRPMQHRWLKRQLRLSTKGLGIPEFLKRVEEPLKAALDKAAAAKSAADVSIKEEECKPAAEAKAVSTENIESIAPESLSELEPAEAQQTEGEVIKPEIKGDVIVETVAPTEDPPAVDEETKSADESNRPDENVGKVHFIHRSPPCQGFMGAGGKSVSKGEGDSPSKEEPISPSVKSNDESFLSDADGNGSIAEVIGRTLDICVQAVDAITDEIEHMGSDSSSKSTNSAKSKSSSADEDGEAMLEDLAVAAATVAVDAFSVGSSMVSSMTDVIKKMEDTKTSDIAASHSTVGEVSVKSNEPSLVTGATILNSVDENKQHETTKVEDANDDASDGEDSWSVVEDDEKKANNDESIARATEMIGSALFNSDLNSDIKDDSKSSNSSTDSLSPVVLARWETELKKLHEIGFLDDRKNVDALEHLEASHLGVDSTDEISINTVIEHLLGNAV